MKEYNNIKSGCLSCSSLYKHYKKVVVILPLITMHLLSYNHVPISCYPGVSINFFLKLSNLITSGRVHVFCSENGNKTYAKHAMGS